MIDNSEWVEGGTQGRTSLKIDFFQYLEQIQSVLLDDMIFLAASRTQVVALSGRTSVQFVCDI